MSNRYRQLPPLGTLVAFEAALRLRSFSRAADEIALSQASVSRQVRQLEENLGLRLFVRQRHDVQPTPAGERLAESVVPALRELTSTAQELRAIGSGRRRFTVFSDISIASGMITPMIADFQRRHPQVQLRVLSSYEPIQQVEEAFDLGFQVGRIAESLFDIEAIADDAVFPVCAPDFLRRLPPSPGPEEVAKQPLLHLEELGYDWPNWRRFLAFFRMKEPRPAEDLVFSSYQVILDLAERGEGIALGWARSVGDRIDAGRLVRIPGMTMPIAQSIFAYRPRLAEPNPLVDEFIALLRARVEPLTLSVGGK